jgi:predicted CoA-binding protein
MPTIKEAASDFLANKRVAVTGVSREANGHGGNVVYQRLRDRGYEVFAVNPNADEVEGDPSYHDLRSIPGGVDGRCGCTAGPARAASRRRPPPTGGTAGSR